MLPVTVVAAAGIFGLVTASFAGTGSATSGGAGSGRAVTGNTAATAGPRRTEAPASAAAAARAKAGTTRTKAGRKSAGTDPVSYQTTTAAQIRQGRELFQATCASCHGTNADGTAKGIALAGLGAGTVDLWVSNGWMPLQYPTVQPVLKPPLYSKAQAASIAQFVASLGGESGPGIPDVNLKNASQAEGFSLFALNCAACHTITGAGDALASGYFAPTLHVATKTQIAEAIRTGPGNMPVFGPKQIPDKELADIVAYVKGGIQHPDNPGGLPLGGIGPVAEGFIALLAGVGLLMLAAYWIGDKRK